MTTQLRLAVFDMDGTLIDSQGYIQAAMALSFARTGLPAPTEAQVLSIVGLSLPEAMAELSPGAGPAEIEALVDAYKGAFVDLRARTGGEAGARLYPGAQAALERLATRPELLLGIATGKARRGVDHALDAHDWRGFFHTAHCADGHPSKPHPSMLQACMADVGVEPHQAVMIGDTAFDILMAKAAGMAAVGVSWGYHPVERLLDAGADAIIDHFDALDAALDRIWGEG